MRSDRVGPGLTDIVKGVQLRKAVRRETRVSVNYGSLPAFAEDPGLSNFFNFLMPYGNAVGIGRFFSILHIRNFNYAGDFSVPTAMGHLYHHNPRC